ncbi:MAG: hypothetical protein QNK29_00185 [Desulfobacterales bacterium]|nr:hypothetical protein [Desulfobacterales bacterium]MDX2510450.1 hypothetical protein [Desulfobacterales bacterium]
MAKMKKRKLCWKASESQQVVGYRLYWAEGGEVGYDAPFAALGNVTEVVLPDGVNGFSHKGGPIEFGVAAVDELGNESDLTTFEASYQFNIPLAPEGMWIEALDEFHTEREGPDDEKSPDPITLIAKSGDPKIESEALVAPIEAKDDDGSYSSAQLYGHLNNNRGV